MPTRVLTGSADKSAILWEAAGGKILQTFQGHHREVTSVALSGDGKFVMTGSEDKSAIRGRRRAAKKLQTLQGHISAATSVGLSDDGSASATASWTEQ
jgi:WD40 repeat protein